MAWATLPGAWVDGTTVTSSFLNSIKTNFDETAPAKATASGRFFAATGVNTIAERVPTGGFVSATETTASTSYANLSGGATGPAVTVTSGTQALLILTGGMFNSTVNAEAYMGCVTSGATTNAAADPEAIKHTSATASAQLLASWAYVVPLTAGSNTFTAKYRVSSGTGSFFDRRVCVVPF